MTERDNVVLHAVALVADRFAFDVVHAGLDVALARVGSIVRAAARSKGYRRGSSSTTSGTTSRRC